MKFGTCIFDDTLQQYPGQFDTNFVISLYKKNHRDVKTKLESHINKLEQELKIANNLKNRIEIIQLWCSIIAPQLIQNLSLQLF